MASQSTPRAPRRVAVLGGNRIPFARSNGPYAKASNQDMLTATVDGLVARYGLAGERLGEVVAGAVLKHSRDFNLTRETVLGTRLDPATPAYDIQQACGTGLEAAVLVANKIALGQVDAGIAGGSTAPATPRSPSARACARPCSPPTGPGPRGSGPRPSPACVPVTSCPPSPRTSSRAPACRWASTWPSPRRSGASPGRPRTRLAAASHQHLAAAYERGFFDDLVTPYLGVSRDTNLRADSTVEKPVDAQARLRQG